MRCDASGTNAAPVGVLSASTSVVRLIAAPPTRIQRDALAAAVSRRAFREPELDLGDRRETSGWVGIHDPLVTELSVADLFFQHYLVVGFRWDRRVVPPKLLWLERRRLEAERRAERGVERLAAPERKEITDAHRVFPGDGVAPLAVLFRTLRATGFRGMLSLEVFNREYWNQDALLVARTGLEKTREAVRAALA